MAVAMISQDIAAIVTAIEALPAHNEFSRYARQNCMWAATAMEKYEADPPEPEVEIDNELPEAAPAKKPATKRKSRS